MYKLIAMGDDSHLQSVIRLSDGAIIPMHHSNIDYQKYLEWLNEGNTPEEAE